MVNPDGSGFARVPGPAGSRSDPSWSPGRSLVYVARATHATFLYKQNADGGRPTALLASEEPDRGRFPSWSPDGKRIAYAGKDGLYVFGGGKTHRIAKGHVDARPAWSPDGAHIAFADRVLTSRYGSDTFIRIVGSDGTGLTTLTGLPSLPNRPSWSPDGTLIAFSAPRAEAPSRCSWFTPDGSAMKQLTNIAGGAASPTWSPDGSCSQSRLERPRREQDQRRRRRRHRPQGAQARDPRSRPATTNRLVGRANVCSILRR